MWAAALLAGCHDRYPLHEVPILGGTDAQVELVRAELLAFDRAIGPGRLEIEAVSFEPVKVFAWGEYYRGRIELDPHLPLEEVTRVTRHELCHALDDAERMEPALRAELDANVSIVLADVELDVGRGAVHERREVLANLCELGPLFASAFRASCKVGEDWTRVAQWLDDVVWTDDPDVFASTPPLDTGPRHTPPAGTTDAHLNDSESEIVRLSTSVDGGGSWNALSVNVYTGAVVAEEPTSAQGELVEDELPTDHWVDLDWVTGWSEGPGAAQLRLPVFPPSGIAGTKRLVLWDGEEVVLPDDGGCLPETRWSLFHADGRIWMSEFVGGVLSWWPIFG